MGWFRCGRLSDLVVSGVGANLDVLGPSDLPKLTDVNRAKECLVREWRKYAAPNVASEVDDALHAVGIRQAKTVFRKRLDFDWSIHGEKMPVAFRSASREWPNDPKLGDRGARRAGCGKAAVANEIGAGLKAGVNLPDLAVLDWIDPRDVPSSPWPVPRDIHRGEAEVIALAGSLHESKMILDDLAARRHPRLLGLKFTGTPGVLLQAKKTGLLNAVLPVVDRLERPGFRLAESTRIDFLKPAGEI